MKKSNTGKALFTFGAIMSVIGIINFALTAIGFKCFIMEEALQRRSMGLWPLISNGHWEEARACMRQDMSKMERDWFLLRNAARINPISGKEFRSYLEADMDSYFRMRKMVEEEYQAAKDRKWRNGK